MSELLLDSGNFIFLPKAIEFFGFGPHPPRLSPSQAGDGGQAESQKDILKILLSLS